MKSFSREACSRVASRLLVRNVSDILWSGRWILPLPLNIIMGFPSCKVMFVTPEMWRGKEWNNSCVCNSFSTQACLQREFLRTGVQIIVIIIFFNQHCEEMYDNSRSRVLDKKQSVLLMRFEPVHESACSRFTPVWDNP